MAVVFDSDYCYYEINEEVHYVMKAVASSLFSFFPQKI